LGHKPDATAASPVHGLLMEVLEHMQTRFSVADRCPNASVTAIVPRLIMHWQIHSHIFDSTMNLLRRASAPKQFAGGRNEGTGMYIKYMRIPSAAQQENVMAQPFVKQFLRDRD